jgi:Ulp1 family protease
MPWHNFCHLRPSQWLNDEVVNAYVALLDACKESNPFQAKLNNTSVYCLNSKVHPDMMAVKGEKELYKQG